MAFQKSSQTATKIVFKPLRTNLFYIVCCIFFLKLGNTKSYAQEIGKQKKAIVNKSTKKSGVKTDKSVKVVTKTDTIRLDSIKKNKALLESKVKYKAKESAKFEQKKKLLTLRDEAELYYEDYELKSGVIVMDYEKNEVYAGRLKDSAGNYIQLPYFKQGSNIIEPDSIRFNFKTKKALVFNSRTSQGEMNIKAAISKKQSDSVYFMKNARITTAKDIDDPEYYFLARKAKFVTGKDKKVVVGFTNMFLANVPTPLALPFAFFPITTTNTSGIIIPSYGQSFQRGYSLQNGGYYFAISNNVDLALIGDYYTNGSYAIRGETHYAQKYKFNGVFNVRFENLINSERGYPDYSKTNIYNIQWSHTKDSKSNPNSRFSASVNLGSSRYFQNTINVVNPGATLINNLSSSITYNKTFNTVPQVNVGVSATHSQNTQTKAIIMTLPHLVASVDRIFPFASNEGSKKGFIKNINLNYSLDATNSINTVDSLFLKKEMFNTARTGFNHSIPIGTNYKIFKYFSATSAVNYNEVWTLNTIKRRTDFSTGKVEETRVNGFDSFRTYSFTNSVSTTIYGTYNFNGKGKLKSIRHVMTPSISHSLMPSFDKYFEKYETPTGYTSYTRFDGGISSPSQNSSSTIGIGLSNILEAKVTDKDSTQTEPKKIKLLNALNFATGYDIVSGRWSQISMNGGTLLLNQKMNVNFGALINPYQKVDSFNNVITSPFAVTNANLTMSYQFASSADVEKKKKSTQNVQNGSRPDDLFGTNTTTSDQLDPNKSEEKEEKFAGFYNADMPWDLNMNYNITYSNGNGESKVSTSSLMLSGNIQLTPKWKIGANSGYDMVNKGVTSTQIRISRDLLSWRMDFSWVPFGPYQFWSFFIGIKSSILSDIKYDKQNQADRVIR